MGEWYQGSSDEDLVVTVEVPARSGRGLDEDYGCFTCGKLGSNEDGRGPLIYVNSEGRDAPDHDSDEFCSWICLLIFCARIEAHTGETTYHSQVTVRRAGVPETPWGGYGVSAARGRQIVEDIKAFIQESGQQGLKGLFDVG